MTAEKNPVFSAGRWLWLVEYGCGRYNAGVSYPYILIHGATQT